MLTLYKALYSRVCISLAKRFIVPRGLHIRPGIEIMICDGRHHLCTVHVVNDMQYVVFDCCNVRCVHVLFFRTCFKVLYSQLWNVLHFYIPYGSRFLNCNKNKCFFWSFHH